MSDHDDLPFGLYERLITAALKTNVLEFNANRGHADSAPPVLFAVCGSCSELPNN